MKKFALIVVAALCGIGTSTAKAESLQAMRTQMTHLQTTITYAKRFATHDRVVIRQGYEWVVIGPYVEQLIQHADVDAHRAHLQLMRTIIIRSTKQYNALSIRYKASLLPAHYQAWLCIHHYEGSWTDPNAPYWGGLQMDIAFMSTYGPPVLLGKPSTPETARELFARFGTADHWSPLQQMWVAERAYGSGRGFYPWPNTARYCGLI